MKPHIWKRLLWVGTASLTLVLLAGCGSGLKRDTQHEPMEIQPVRLDEGEKLKVVATTNIVGDVVSQVGGDRIEMTTLMGVGVDPHSYVPTPSDTAAVHDAHVVFANGLGLEEFLGEMLERAGGNAFQVHLSEGLDVREAKGSSEEGEHGQESADPHVWFDPQNVIHWVSEIEQTLSILDPPSAETYAGNAEEYRRILKELDTWIGQQVATIPDARRKLVTNHPSFGYFADRYGLEQVGAIYPINPSSEPSAQDIAALENAIRAFGVSAVFAESTVHPKLAQQVAKDTGIEVVPLYTGSLGDPGSGAESYVDMMRYNVKAIVEALK